jgi:hypothetical protein
MARISRQTQIDRLIELYSREAAVRDRVFQDTKQEITRINQELPWVSADWVWLRVTDEQYEKRPIPTFDRLMHYYFESKGNEWISEQYKINRDEIMAMLAEEE